MNETNFNPSEFASSIIINIDQILFMSRRLKILCLHGFTSNGAVHAHQLRRITKLLPEYDFLFPDGPHKVDITSQMDLGQPENKDWSNLVNGMSSSGHRAWYFAREKPQHGEGKGEFVGLETSLESIGKMLKEEDDVRAILGFSQGAGLVGMLCALLHTRQNEHPLRKLMPMDLPTPLACIAFAGFKARFSQYDSVYDDGIDAPILHVIGAGDSLVRHERSQALIHICSRAKILKHDGGHNIPKGDAEVAEIVQFIRQHVTEG